MKILIDAHMVGENETGNEMYVLNLLRGLIELRTNDSFVLAATHPDVLRKQVRLPDAFEVRLVSANPFRRLFVDLPRIIRRERVNVVHSTYVAPIPAPCALVLSIHDVAYKRNPEWFSFRDLAVLRSGIALSVPRARLVVTLSNHAKRQICELLNVTEKNVVVTYLAADRKYCAGSQPSGERLSAINPGVRRPYILAVGNLEPKKNLSRLIAAFRRARASHDIPHRLVIVGQRRWPTAGLEDELRSQSSGDVILTGYVKGEDLPDLYRGADVLVCPSLHEGFGLPPIEAMACGTPVVCSNTSSLPEVVGDAAVLVDPLSVDGIADGILSVLLNEDMKSSLRRKGLLRAASFSWQQTARLTYDTYLRAAQPAE